MGLGNWALRTFIEKYVKRLIQIVIAWVVGHNLERFGVTIDQNQASLAVWSGLELVRNFLKVRFGWKVL